MIFTYVEGGGRIPFDPLTMGEHLAGCCLCGRLVRDIGIFVPTTDAMRAVVLKLRRHPVRRNSTACVAYGVCGRCGDSADLPERVERWLETAAERVTVQ